jgi:endonuclease/exonuclease/phosphatase family metal-dependent hydrolase
VRSRWRTGIGVVLGLVLATLLVGRATGVVGGGGQILADAGSEGTPAATPSSPATVGQTRATSAPRLSPARPDEADRPARPSWKKQRPSAPDGLATQMPDGEDLAAAVQDLLGTRPDREPDAVPLEFRVSSFNVLGASHTTARGNKARYASGTARMPGSVRLLQDVGADVVGFQEYELVQHQAFTRLTGGRYDVYPGASLGRGPLRNSVAWRQDTWELVDARTIPIPYFRGNRVPMPYVLLRHRESAQPVYFINIHNPASNKKRGDNERWRDLATKMEITLADRLARQVGVPVVLMGDFNERQEAFCRVTGAGLVAANGGAASPCRPPANAGIDWIFGTRDITFSDYQRLDSPLVNRLTDHPVLTATARVGG